MTLRALISTALVALFLCGTSSSTLATRVVMVRISLNGELILQGYLSDDGSPDADEVWEGLKTVNLEEGEAFAKLRIAPDLKEYRIVGTAGRAEAPPIRLEVDYGGVAQLRALTIRRMPPDPAGRVWRIAAEDVDGSFDGRMLSRREAARLANPKLEKARPNPRR